MAGYTFKGTGNDILILRYNTDGSPDTTFDIDGIATYDVAKDSQDGLGVAIQSDGKIVVAGKTYNGSDYNYDVVVLRCTTTGSLDAPSEQAGFVTYDGTFGMILVTE